MNPEEKPNPRVGVGILIINDRQEVLLGLRHASHGAGEWSFPGGNLDFGEKIFEAAQREVKEETDLDITEYELISVCDEMRYIPTDNKHYINLGVLGKYEGGEPKLMEPDKCVEWKWFPIDSIPENLFEPTGYMLKNFQNKKIYQP